MKKFFIILYFIVCTAIIAYGTTIIILVRTNRNYLGDQLLWSIKSDDKVYTYLQERTGSIRESDRTKLRNDVAKEIDIHCYIYEERPRLKKNVLGYTVFPIRKIVIKSSQSLSDYLATVTHEFIHLKYYTLNERWTEFESFKLLYESDNPDLHQAGINLGFDYIRKYTEGDVLYGRSPLSEYDISYYVYNYLGGKLCLE